VRNVLLVAHSVFRQLTARFARSPIITDWMQCAIKLAFKDIFLNPLKESAKIVPTIAILVTYMEAV